MIVVCLFAAVIVVVSCCLFGSGYLVWLFCWCSSYSSYALSGFALSIQKCFDLVTYFFFSISFPFMQAVQFLLASRERLSTEKTDDLSVKDGSSSGTRETEPQKVDPIQVSWFLI